MKLWMEQDALVCFPSYFLDSSPHHRGKNLFLVLQPLPSLAHLYFTLAADRLTSGREAPSRAANSLAAITLSLPSRGRGTALMKISAQFFAKMLQGIHILKRSTPYLEPSCWIPKSDIFAVGYHDDQPIFPATCQISVQRGSCQAWSAGIPLYH